MDLSGQTLIVLAGCPLTGKTTMGDSLRDLFKIPFIAVDRIRPLLFGQSAKHCDDKVGDSYQLSRAYPVMRGMADEVLQLGDSLILEATFSSKIHGQERIIKYLAEKHKEASLRVILMEIPDEKVGQVIQERVDVRTANGSDSGATTVEDYLRVKKRFEPLEMPHEVVDSTKNFESCREQIIKYVCG